MPPHEANDLVSYFDPPVLKGWVLFATHYPLLEWSTSINDLVELPISEETKGEILWGNAARLFGFGG